MSANDCLGCVHAKWKRTKSGALHPDKTGKCEYVYVIPALPNSRYFISGEPSPCGGSIEREGAYEQDCPYYRVAVVSPRLSERRSP